MIPWPKTKGDREKWLDNAKRAESAREELRNALKGATITVSDLLR